MHGIVDGHFDLGYVVTIAVGNSEFQGHPLQHQLDRACLHDMLSYVDGQQVVAWCLACSALWPLDTLAAAGVLYRPSEERLNHQGSQAPSREASPGRALSTGLLAQEGDFLQLRQHLRQLEVDMFPTQECCRVHRWLCLLAV